MNTLNKKFLYEILYNDDESQAIKEIEKITDSKLLHIIAGNYNWDNSFEIPSSITKNDFCDLGTALMIFYKADGLRLLEDFNIIEKSELKLWIEFITSLMNRIVNSDFKYNDIKFIPPLTKVQIFKLNKLNPNINEKFLEATDGEIIEIPII